MKTFAPSFFNHFSLSLNRFMFIDLLHIKIGNLNWCECGHCKNEAREIDLFFCREVDAMLLLRPKSQSTREHVTIQFLWTTARLMVTHVNFIYLIDKFFLFLL